MNLSGDGAGGIIDVEDDAQYEAELGKAAGYCFFHFHCAMWGKRARLFIVVCTNILNLVIHYYQVHVMSSLICILLLCSMYIAPTR